MGGGKGEDRVAEAAFFPQLLKEPGRHAAPQDAGEQLQRIDSFIAITRRRKAEDQMQLIERTLGGFEAAGKFGRRPIGRRSIMKGGEAFVRRLDDASMVDV